MSEEEKTPTSEEQIADSQEKNSIKEITRQSWNLELLISGVAIYFAASLPELIENLYDYYQYNFFLQEDSRFFPLLIYALFESFSYILIFAFILHFILRAFWVGMIGLLAVFPDGIQYDKLPQNKMIVEELRKSFGSFEGFTQRLDKTCSIILSVTFMIVLMSLGISIVYFALFVVIETGRMVLDEEVFKLFSLLFFSFVGLLALAFSIFAGFMNLKKNRLKSSNSEWQFRAMMVAQNVFLPLVSRPVIYLSSMFASNIPRNTYYAWLAGLMVLFMSFLFFIAIQKRGRDILENRFFYSKGASTFRVNNSNYENLLNKDAYILFPVIQADVLKEPYLKLFIPYTKDMDKNLEMKCSPVSNNDTIQDRGIRHYKTDSVSIQCLESFINIYVNEKLYPSEFLFHRHQNNGEKGMLSYLPTEKFNIGLNRLIIKKAWLRDEKEQAVIAEIPFYYYPEKNK